MYAGVSVKKPKLYANPARNELTDAINEYRIAIINQLTQYAECLAPKMLRPSLK